MGLLEANQEDGASNQRLCWFGIIRCPSLTPSVSFLAIPPLSLRHTLIRDIILPHRRQIKPAIVNTAAGVLEVVRLILPTNAIYVRNKQIRK